MLSIYQGFLIPSASLAAIHKGNEQIKVQQPRAETQLILILASVWPPACFSLQAGNLTGQAI